MLADHCRINFLPFSFAFDDNKFSLLRPVLTRIVFSISRIIFFCFSFYPHSKRPKKFPFFIIVWIEILLFIFVFVSIFSYISILSCCYSTTLCGIERSRLSLSYAFQFYDNCILYFYAFLFFMLLHWNLVAIGRRWHLHNYRDFV